jgi:hypothetical protein
MATRGAEIELDADVGWGEGACAVARPHNVVTTTMRKRREKLFRAAITQTKKNGKLRIDERRYREKD